jgi:hypothetical protein
MARRVERLRAPVKRDGSASARATEARRFEMYFCSSVSPGLRGPSLIDQPVERPLMNVGQRVWIMRMGREVHMRLTRAGFDTQRVGDRLVIGSSKRSARCLQTRQWMTRSSALCFLPRSRRVSTNSTPARAFPTTKPSAALACDPHRLVSPIAAGHRGDSRIHRRRLAALRRPHGPSIVAAVERLEDFPESGRWSRSAISTTFERWSS